MKFGRGRALRAEAKVLPGEHIVADAMSRGELVVATERALYLGAERLPWTEIAHATWEEPILDLDVEKPGHLKPERLRLELDPAGELPAAVFAQVTASIITSQRITFASGGGAQATARRGDGEEVRWNVHFDAGLDPSDPGLRAEAEAALAALREALGI